MSALLIATNNPGKQVEFRRLLAPLGVPLLAPADVGLHLVPEEPHETYVENARAKARAFCLATGRLTLADDAGIEVAALGWGPGVRTSRFGSEAAGPGSGGRADGVQLLLERLRGQTDRRARMVCCLALAVPDDDEPMIETFEGVMEGRVADRPRGEGGFGFDPIFEFADGLTGAELPPGEKDARSHRGRAAALALPRLRELLAPVESARREGGR